MKKHKKYKFNDKVYAWPMNYKEPQVAIVLRKKQRKWAQSSYQVLLQDKHIVHVINVYDEIKDCKQEIASVQPMSLPQNLLFYLDFSYKSSGSKK